MPYYDEQGNVIDTGAGAVTELDVSQTQGLTNGATGGAPADPWAAQKNANSGWGTAAQVAGGTAAGVGTGLGVQAAFKGVEKSADSRLSKVNNYFSTAADQQASMKRGIADASKLANQSSSLQRGIGVTDTNLRSLDQGIKTSAERIATGEKIAGNIRGGLPADYAPPSQVNQAAAKIYQENRAKIADLNSKLAQVKPDGTPAIDGPNRIKAEARLNELKQQMKSVAAERKPMLKIAGDPANIERAKGLQAVEKEVGGMKSAKAKLEALRSAKAKTSGALKETLKGVTKAQAENLAKRQGLSKSATLLEKSATWLAKHPNAARFVKGIKVVGKVGSGPVGWAATGAMAVNSAVNAYGESTKQALEATATGRQRDAASDSNLAKNFGLQTMYYKDANGNERRLNTKGMDMNSVAGVAKQIRDLKKGGATQDEIGQIMAASFMNNQGQLDTGASVEPGLPDGSQDQGTPAPVSPTGLPTEQEDAAAAEYQLPAGAPYMGEDLGAVQPNQPSAEDIAVGKHTAEVEANTEAINKKWSDRELGVAEFSQLRSVYDNAKKNDPELAKAAMREIINRTYTGALPGPTSPEKAQENQQQAIGRSADQVRSEALKNFDSRLTGRDKYLLSAGSLNPQDRRAAEALRADRKNVGDQAYNEIQSQVDKTRQFNLAQGAQAVDFQKNITAENVAQSGYDAEVEKAQALRDAGKDARQAQADTEMRKYERDQTKQQFNADLKQGMFDARRSDANKATQAATMDKFLKSKENEAAMIIARAKTLMKEDSEAGLQEFDKGQALLAAISEQRQAIAISSQGLGQNQAVQNRQPVYIRTSDGRAIKAFKG